MVLFIYNGFLMYLLWVNKFPLLYKCLPKCWWCFVWCLIHYQSTLLWVFLNDPHELTFLLFCPDLLSSLDNCQKKVIVLSCVLWWLLCVCQLYIVVESCMNGVWLCTLWPYAWEDVRQLQNWCYHEWCVIVPNSSLHGGISAINNRTESSTLHFFVLRSCLF